MANDEDVEEVQFATVSLRALRRQRNPDTGQYEYDLEANVLMRDAEISTTAGNIHVSVNRADLRIALQNCQMDLFNANYQHQEREQKVEQVEENKKKERRWAKLVGRLSSTS